MPGPAPRSSSKRNLSSSRPERPTSKPLVRDQKSVVADTRDASKQQGAAAQKEARGKSHERETGIRKTAARLAADPSFAKLEPPYLKQSDTHLGDALTYLETTDISSAVGSEQRSLELFQKELDRLNEQIGQTEKAVAKPEFQRFEADQARNRTSTDTLGQVSARLGDTGVALQKDLIRAGGAMRSAEGDLAKIAAKPAAEDQTTALRHLAKSRDGLAQAMESLLTELRSELLTRIVAELTEMHEIQASIRETTEAQAPRVAQRSRTALILVAGLSQKEAELGERTEHLLALVEETEFGIALPTSLRVLAREMRIVQGWLKDGDASPRTIKLEKRIEDDLLGLLEAMRRLPPTTPPPPGSPLPSDLAARERELNRLIAELKMIRLLQSRLNDDTVVVDKSRPVNPVLPPDLRREIESLRDNQDEIRASLAKIAERLDSGDDASPLPNPGLIDR